MEKTAFLTLLSDLYERYNPSNKKDIETISQKYVGQELDATYSFLVKYNYPKHPKYDPTLNDLNTIKQLLKDYVEGKRPLLQDGIPKPTIEEQIKNTIVKETESKINNTTEQLQQEVFKFKSELQEEANKILSSLKPVSHGEVKLNILYTDSELNLSKEINNFNVGTRFLIKDVNNKLIGLEIKDVFYDFTSIEGSYIKEITIDKA